MKHYTFCAAALVVALLVPALFAQQKRPIERADELPVHSYAIAKAPSALLRDDVALAELMRSLRADLEADLAKYDIRDAAALRSYYRALSRIALFEHRFDDALDYENRAGVLEDKPAARILSGVLFRPMLAAQKAKTGEAAHAFSTTLAAELARLPNESVQADLDRLRAAFQKQSAALLEGMVLVARLGWSDQKVPPPPTAAWAVSFARSLERTVAYYRNAGVRVVNMSWGTSSRELEHDLEINGVGATSQERRKLAMQYFNTGKSVFQAAIAAAPEILFVASAGNRNERNQFNEFIPASFDLPNTITVGAVD